MELKLLIESACKALLDAGHSPKSVYSKYEYRWNHLLKNNLADSTFTEEMVKTYFINRFKRNLFCVQYDSMTRTEGDSYRVFKTLLSFYNTGKVHTNAKLLKPILSEEKQTLLYKYLQYSKEIGNCAWTIEDKKSIITQFLCKVSISFFNNDEYEKYFETFKKSDKFTARNDQRVVKAFIFFCVQNKLVHFEFYSNFPNIRNIGYKKITTTYTKEELYTLVTYARETKNVENYYRNYAILLILVCYGIRARDVINLKLSNIVWNSSIISIIHSKTKKVIKYPLIPIVENTIIDFIKCERINNDLDFLFQTKNGSEIKISQIITTTINNFLKNSPVIINGRHFGAHAIRHSVASILINNGTSIYNIASFLGHSTVQTTSIYTKVNTHKLLNCALEIDLNE